MLPTQLSITMIFYRFPLLDINVFFSEGHIDNISVDRATANIFEIEPEAIISVVL